MTTAGDPLHDTTVRRALETSMIARIATVSRNGRPNLNPLYFVLAGTRIHLGTSDRTLAARNVEANSDVAILFDAERAAEERSVMRLTGDARVVRDPGVFRRYLLRDVRKYVLTARGLANAARNWRLLGVMTAYERSSDKGRPCVIEVEPSQAEFLSLPG